MWPQCRRRAEPVADRGSHGPLPAFIDAGDPVDTTDLQRAIGCDEISPGRYGSSSRPRCPGPPASTGARNKKPPPKRGCCALLVHALFLVALAAAVAWIVTTARRIFGIVIRPAPARCVPVAYRESHCCLRVRRASCCWCSGQRSRIAAGVWPTSRIAVGVWPTSRIAVG